MSNNPQTELIKVKFVILGMMLKRERIIRYTLLFIALIMPFIAEAQEDSLNYRRERSRHSIYVDFRVNSTVIDKNYRNNNTVLTRVDSLFTELKQDTTITIESVEFSGSASPEGNANTNKRLSRARMDAVEKFVRSNVSFPDDIITHNDRYIDWGHLIELVEADPTLPMRDEVLAIVRTEYPDAKDYRGQTIDGRIPELKKLNNGVIWQELLKRYFVKMRVGAVIMNTYIDVPIEPVHEPEQVVTEEPVEESEEYYTDVAEEEVVAIDEMGAYDTDFAAKYQKNPLVSVKTNLMAYSTLIPNVGVEVRLAPRWSFEITGLYSPYNLFVHDFKTRVLAMKPELRFWWGESLRKGHFIGVHMPIAGFNIQLNEDFRYQDPNHALWGIGLNYGYAMLIGKRQNWSLDFTIGFGYMDLKYDVYEGVRNGKFVRQEEKHYFGPTRVGINLSYIINKKKAK